MANGSRYASRNGVVSTEPSTSSSPHERTPSRGTDIVVNGCDTHEKIACAEKWLLKADITMAEYDELMNTLAYLSRELYSRRWLD